MDLVLKSLKEAIDAGLSFSPDTNDPYNYRKKIRDILLYLENTRP
jgi:hypothetical protein